MPVPPPVTRATRPLRRKMFSNDKGCDIFERVRQPQVRRIQVTLLCLEWFDTTSKGLVAAFFAPNEVWERQAEHASYERADAMQTEYDYGHRGQQMQTPCISRVRGVLPIRISADTSRHHLSAPTWRHYRPPRHQYGCDAPLEELVARRYAVYYHRKLRTKLCCRA